MQRVIQADHVLPGDAPPIANGVVVVDDNGTVIDVGDASSLGVSSASAEHIHIKGVIFPGLVNAHTHIELSWMRGKVPGGHGFVPWVDRLIATRSESNAEDIDEGVGHGIDELVKSATVAVGDVTNTLSPVMPLARHGIGGCIFHEVLGLDRDIIMKRIEGLRAEVEERVPAWPSKDLAYAPSPHTLFTLHEDAARVLLESALKRNLRASLHLAEHPAERRAVEQGDGPVREWYERIVKQTPSWPKRPLFDLAEDVLALREGVVLVHLTDARPDELARVAKSKASVVLCPRSNLFIEAKLPPLLAVREAGIEAALGTDSLASNTSLDVLAEARALNERFPKIPAWELVKMATWNGARALGRTDIGRIAKGTRPGIYAVDLQDLQGDANRAADGAQHLLANLRAPRRCVVERRFVESASA